MRKRNYSDENAKRGEQSHSLGTGFILRNTRYLSFIIWRLNCLIFSQIFFLFNLSFISLFFIYTEQPLRHISYESLSAAVGMENSLSCFIKGRVKRGALEAQCFKTVESYDQKRVKYFTHVDLLPIQNRRQWELSNTEKAYINRYVTKTNNVHTFFLNTCFRAS